MNGNLLFIVVLALEADLSAALSNCRHHYSSRRRNADNICRSPGRLKLAIQQLQVDTEYIKYNIRCRMDPGTCSESMLTTSGESCTPLKLNGICTKKFLRNLCASMEQFYTKFSRIRAHITILQSDLILSTDDPLQTLTNRLSNDIRNAIQASQPNVALSFPVTETSDGTSVESSESVMLEDLKCTIKKFDHFTRTVYNILNRKW